MHLDESDIVGLLKDGIRVRGEKGGLAPTPKPAPDRGAEVVEAIRLLADAMEQIANREVPTPKAPSVSVQPAKVSVNPTIQVNPPRLVEIEGEVTERDRDGYMKKMKFRLL